MKTDVKKLYDYHMHSVGSFDGKNSVNELAEHGLKVGLKGICVTEHHDSNKSYPEYGYYNPSTQIIAVNEARDKYGDEIEIYNGLEVDYEPFLESDVKEMIEKIPNLDVRLGSVHVSCFGLQFNFLDQIDKMILSNADFEKLYNVYYNDLEALIKSDLFDVIAHIDYPKRCGVRTINGEVPTIYYDGMDKIMKLAADSGIAIEINTRNAIIGKPLTAPEFAVDKYIEYGGRYITLGSDTHAASQIGNSLYMGYNVLEKHGIGQTIFIKREPKILDLIK